VGFVGVQLGIHRHRTKAGVPDGVHDLDRFHAVGHGEGHAVALGEAEAHPQMRAHHRHLAPQVAIGEMRCGPARQRRQIAEFAGRSQQEMGDIHGDVIRGPDYCRCGDDIAM